MMGVPRLKKKTELNYRLGKPGQWCDECANYVEHFQVRKLNGTLLSIEHRCKVMGLQNGRAYRVRPIYCCDKYYWGKTHDYLPSEKKLSRAETQRTQREEM
jgi:hypothetical protein